MKLAITNFFMPNGACTVHCTTQLLPYNKLTKSKRPRSIKLAILFCTGFSLKAIAQNHTLSRKNPAFLLRIFPPDDLDDLEDLEDLSSRGS